MVFIGKDLNHEVIQMLLDRCLLSDEEMEMGPRMWQEAMWDLSPIKLPAKLFLDHNVIDDNVIKVQESDDGNRNNMAATFAAAEVFEDKDEDFEVEDFLMEVELLLLLPT